MKNDKVHLTHKDLDVWNKSMILVEDLYKMTKSFPDEEKYSLTSQIRRAAVSVPSNISEGAARNSKKEFIHFLYISLGSISELETQLIISKRLGYFENKEIFKKIMTIRKMLIGLIKSLK